MGMYTLHKGFWEDKHIFSGFHSSVMWPPIVYELVWPQGLFGWSPDHMGWFALLLLVKFKTPGWFYFISYSFQVVHFGDWEHCVKVWWVTKSESKVSRPLFTLVLQCSSWGYDLFCVEEWKLHEKGSVKQTNFTDVHWPLYVTLKCHIQKKEKNKTKKQKTCHTETVTNRKCGVS